MKYLCGRCIHFDVCYVPRTKGCVEICGHFKEEPKEPQTEQEYLQTCTTEQLAKHLVSTFDLCGAGCHHCFLAKECLTKAKNGNPLTQEQMIVEWLKQPHHNEVEK